MQPIRRRKKRPNYGVRTVEVCRSENGFGFTISGQQPCILSCIVPNSPAEKAGLRPGDYLIAVCGQNVSKVPHDDVVQLIGSCYGVLKLQIAENYYSDSSEEDFITTVRQKPKYHKYKNNVQTHLTTSNKVGKSHDAYINDNFRHCSGINSPTVNAKVIDTNKCYDVPPFINHNLNLPDDEWLSQSIVGYLGTIEMPRKLTPVSRLQIIRGCIKRLRSEKRNYIAVLMTVFPCSLRLKNESGTTIAVYPGGRVTFCSANSEQDRKFFGIVTTSLEEEPSNSCHVFVILSSVHDEHIKEAIKFKVNCKTVESSAFCEQFPPSCDSIITAVQKYYENQQVIPRSVDHVIANSPLPSNDSTTTSNSDSGIGFRDESGHQSDRILVVDIQNQRLHIQAAGNSNLQYIDCTDYASVREDATRTSDSFSQRSQDLSFPPFFSANEQKWRYDNCYMSKTENLCISGKCDDTDCRPNLDANLEVSRDSQNVINTSIKNSRSEMMLLNKLTVNHYNNTNDKYCISHSLEDLKSQKEINDIEVSENITRKHSLQNIAVFSACDNQGASDQGVEQQATRKEEEPATESNASDWALSLEKLLYDNIGIHVFAEFLRKEFSVENVYFWSACEKYKLITDTEAKKYLAKNIYEKYLSADATDPVNVDSTCQQLTQQQLNNATSSLFNYAQKQIFNLMKFDCYPRFIKSNLYKHFLINALTEETLSAVNVKLDPELIVTEISRKANQDEVDKQCRGSRRRRSLMPWSRSRCKSRDRSSNDNISSSSGSRCSLSSWDLTLPVTLCRVVLPDSSTAVLNIQTELSVKSVISKLLEKRSCNYTSFHVISTSSDKPINLEDNSNVLSGKEVKIEWRVEFILDLPNRKSLVIKSKPSHSLAAVLSPILLKHGYNLQMVTLCLISENEVIEPTALVSTVDKRRVQVLTRSTPIPNTQGFNNNVECELNAKCVNLDEITNKVFEELLQGKADNFRSNKMVENAASIHSEEWGSEHSSGILGRFLRRDSFFQDRHRRHKKCADATDTTEKKHINKLPPITTKWNPMSKLDASFEKEGLYEDLKRAQRGRLDDQRGTEINIELPDFLKDKENVPCNRKKLRKIRKDCSVGEECKNSKNANGSLANRNNNNNNNILINNNNNNVDVNTEVINVDKNATFTTGIQSSKSTTNTMDISQSSTICAYPIKIYPNNSNSIESSINNNNNNVVNNIGKLGCSEPPPLPPKPKNIPYTWRTANINISNNSNNNNNNTFCQKFIYLDQPSSSFV